jgi:hypothetical protein
VSRSGVYPRTGAYISLGSRHRYPDTHSCSPPDTSSSKDGPSAARQLLEKNFGSTLSSSSTGSNRTTTPLLRKKVPTDPVKLAQYKKLELMKMRHKAVPADVKDKTSSVPADQRLTVNVRYGQSQKVFWLRKVRPCLYSLDANLCAVDRFRG